MKNQICKKLPFLAVILLTLFQSGTTMASDLTTLDKYRGDSPSFTVSIDEKNMSSFIKDPVAYIETNFDPAMHPVSKEHKKYDKFIVFFKCGKGTARAEYSKKWELQKTSVRFKNVLLPMHVRQALLTEYPGWEMVKNKISYTKRNGKQYQKNYSLKLKKDGKSQQVKIIESQEGLVFI